MGVGIPAANLLCALALVLLIGTPTFGQAQEPAAVAAGPASEVNGEKVFDVEAGTKIPLRLLNSISTKTVVVGDPVYLQTAFPVVIGGKIVIPPGSYVKGSVTGVKRAGKVKGRSELYVRFDALTLPNGVTRDFRSRPGSVDASARGQMEREEGKVKGEGNKTGDAVKTGEAAAWGTMIGGVAGQSGMGAGIGAAAGAAAGLMGVLLTRGPDVVLEGGTTIEMVLDRNLKFSEKELSPPAGSPLMPGSPPTAQQGGSGWGRRP